MEQAGHIVVATCSERDHIHLLIIDQDGMEKDDFALPLAAAAELGWSIVTAVADRMEAKGTA